ncbi:probable ADP-ribosylation factor GTPase-activating protein AGD15 isoform X3 [Beta vulgaris subsp. vulgaris]|uniref:probable ADP-ribosylation factor GTPase-activating protein AGD15 isoform X3 n=1 Tax=Beta vulgaris subsp. vulgaris TaxID=3555 RepID=UPI0025468FB0|nr:probable ADP-ribosylation factor GTPase-activating protein AGD15 isoform X3 [Beta vulgaris subsp. vulgaris]
MINAKASVSKDINNKNSKVLEGLLKLPQNRECADCRSKGPRWASINLGIFICMQCSGIHRSLGVHISQVRSITLDTWLPEQVAFMQSMGNGKSNDFWEAQLPQNHDRSEIDTFIRVKYVDKRWVAKTATNPIAIPKGRNPRCNNKYDDWSSKNGIPKIPKGSSLDEQAFDSYMEKCPPVDLKTRTAQLKTRYAKHRELSRRHSSMWQREGGSLRSESRRRKRLFGYEYLVIIMSFRRTTCTR